MSSQTSNQWIPSIIGPLVSLLIAGVGFAFYIGQQDKSDQELSKKIEDIAVIVPKVNEMSSTMQVLRYQYDTMDKRMSRMEQGNDTMTKDIFNIRLQIAGKEGAVNAKDNF